MGWRDGPSTGKNGNVRYARLPAEQNDEPLLEEEAEGEERKESHSPLWGSHRLRICLLLSAAMYVGSANRMSMNVSIVCMVNATQQESSDAVSSCQQYANDGEQRVERPDVDLLTWSPSDQSLLLSSTFYGTLTTIAFSGTIADSHGPVRVLAGAFSCSALLMLLVPLLARNSFNLLMFTRFLSGVLESFLNPSVNCIAVRWFPKSEKATLAAFYTSGQQIAAGFGSLLAAYLCQSVLLGGWPSIFYIFGGVGVAFVLLWRSFASDTPRESKWTTSEEKEFLAANIPAISSNKPSFHSVPWRDILASRPFHAILSCTFVFGYTTALMQAFLPLFLKERLGMHIERIGFYTLVMFTVQMMMKSFFYGPLIDYSVKRRMISLTNATKLAQCLGSFGVGLSFVLLSTFTCENSVAAMAILIVYGMSKAGSTCGYFTSLISIAPRYTGTLTSLVNVSRVLAACLASTMATVLTSAGTPYKWTILYCSAAIFQLLAGIHYALGGDTDVQPWALDDKPAREADK